MRSRLWLFSCGVLAACGAEDGEVGPATPEQTQVGGAVTSAAAITYRDDVTPVTRVADARPGVFIPPFRQCSAPRDGKPGQGPDGKVCANVMISGATEPGRWFADYASCDVVVRQRPYWPAPPAGKTAAGDPRLVDAAYMKELAWVTEQAAATGCVCCHDSKLGRAASQWDIRAEGVWLDSLSNTGLALFAGLADSSVLGAYPAADNFGFAREQTGLPSNDPDRMQRFMLAELERRGITREQARAVPPFGGPIYTNSVVPPSVCKAGEGVDPSGRVLWNGGGARYVYVLEKGSRNPGVPPNFDLPEGTLFRVDVLASAEPIASGFRYGTTPSKSFQVVPESTPAKALVPGTTYHLTVLRDVGLPLANCLFEFGKDVEAPAAPKPDAGAVPGGKACTLAAGDASGFGATCKSDADCSCAASYCALQPGASSGYCTKTGCNTQPSLCPTGWSCFDLSRFAPGLPAFCSK